MPKILKNLTNRQVFIQLNSNSTVALAPKEKSNSIRGIELVNNSLIIKLKEQGVIDICDADEKKEKTDPVKKTVSVKKNKKEKKPEIEEIDI